MSVICGVRRETGRTDVTVHTDACVGPLHAAPGRPRPERAPYDWGAQVPGSERLAAALLYLATGAPLLTDAHAPDYACEVVARLPREGWALATEEVWRWLIDRNERGLRAEVGPEGEGGA
jgi:hypothetical protein